MIAGEAWLRGVKRLGNRKGRSNTKAPAMAPPLWLSLLWRYLIMFLKLDSTLLNKLAFKS